MKRISKLFKNMSKQGNEVINENMSEENHNNNDETTEKMSEGEGSFLDENEAKIHELEQRLAEVNDKHLRLYSEFDNFRKRNTKERIELIKTAGEDIFKAFLPVIDDLERALKANETAVDMKAVNEGVHLIYNKMKNTFIHKGLEVMDCMGKAFDSEIMEAITRIPAPSEDLVGKVVDELEKGYMLNGKVIRFAKVIVGS